MNWPFLNDCNTLDELAAWAASNHVQSMMPHDWKPLLERAFYLGQLNGIDRAKRVLANAAAAVAVQPE